MSYLLFNWFPLFQVDLDIYTPVCLPSLNQVFTGDSWVYGKFYLNILHTLLVATYKGLYGFHFITVIVNPFFMLMDAVILVLISSLF